MAEHVSVRQADAFTEPEAEYQAVERLAVFGLLAGLISPLAMLGSLWSLVPAVGIVFDVMALRRIGLDPNLIGRKAALAGLSLSVLFGVAPLAQWLTSSVLLSRQARPAADLWFECLRENSPEKALMLTFAPDSRRPFDDGLWDYYRNDRDARHRLNEFVKNPLVRTLLALGKRAEVRFDKTEGVSVQTTLGRAVQLYTVTYTDESEKKTFFVRLMMERKPTEKPWMNPWRVVSFLGGVDPNKLLE